MKNRNRILAGAAALSLAMGMLPGCAAGTSNTVATVTAAESHSTQAAAQVTFSDSGITTSAAAGLTIQGTALTITQSGTYALSGSCSDGSIEVEKSVSDVYLVLNGLNLTAKETAPIVCGKETQVTIEVSADTENTLADTPQNNTDTGKTDAENAVIKCKDGSQVLLCGEGTLHIQANGKNGIKSGTASQNNKEASLTIRELTLNIEAPFNDAINAEMLLNVESGTLTISAGDDALHSDDLLSIGSSKTQGPTIVINECDEGLEGAQVNVYSGDVTIHSTDDCINAANGDLSEYSFQLNIFGGKIRAYSSEGDGFDSNGDLTISGGDVEVWTANRSDNEPLDADGTVTVSGGTVLAAGGSSGMGMNLNAQQPCLIFETQQEMKLPENRETPESPDDLTEKQGTAGNPEGTEKPTSMDPPEDGKPSEDTQKPQGQKVPHDGGGAFFMGGASGSLLTSGSSFSILDSDGNTLCSGTADSDVSYIFFSSPDLTDAETCTLSSADSQTTAQVQSGTIRSGMGGRPGGGSFGQRPNDDQRPDRTEKPDHTTSSGDEPPKDSSQS